MPSAAAQPPRRRRAATIILVGLLVLFALSGTACVGQLGRNDDDVKPDSHRPSVDRAIRLSPILAR